MKTADDTTRAAQTAVMGVSRPVTKLDEAWSEQTLQHILSTPTPTAPPHRSRTRRLGVVALALGTLGFGGVAYAVVGAPLPDVFSRSIDAFSNQMDSPKPEMVQVADLTLPDGSRFAAWRGGNAQLDCSAFTSDWDGTDALGWGWTTCTDVTPGEPDLNRAHISWAGARSTRSSGAPSRYFPVLVGHTTSPDTTQVVVSGTASPSGQTINETLSVDPTTGSFATVLPGSETQPFERDPRPGLIIRFLDADGAEVETPASPAS